MADLITLTDVERDKFAAYLEQDAASNDIIIKQMGNIDGIPAEMLRIKKVEAMACRVVAGMLRRTRSEVIGG